jgi:hypothetical protein
MWFALESMRELPELDRSPLLNLPEGFVPLIGIALGRPAKPLTERNVKTERLSINYL